MFKSNSGITPVVTTSLILVVVVLSVVNFNSFYTNFESSVVADLNDNSNSISSLEVQGVYNNYLYLKSDNDELEILKILDKNGSVMCDYKSELLLNYDLVNSWSFNEILKNLSGSYIIDDLTSTEMKLIDLNISNLDFDTKPLLVNSILGNGLEFDGVDDQAEKIGYGNLFTYQDFAISMWFNWDGGMCENGNGYNDCMLIYNPIGWQDGGWRLKLGQNITNVRQLEFSVSNGTNNFHSVSGFNFESNKFYNLYFSYSHGLSKFYVNGLNIFNHTEYGTLYQNTLDLLIGSGAGSGVGIFNGIIDEVKIFNSSLSNNEISNLYYFNSPILNILQGINKIGLPGCRLENGKSYGVLIKTKNSNLIKNTIIVK